MITRPMLAARAKSYAELRFPCGGTPKLDGIRALRIGDSLLTRSFKLVQNEHVQATCQPLPRGLDGELVAGDTFQSTTSAIMSRDGAPDFRYFVFDYVHAGLDEPYYARAERLSALDLPAWCVKVLPTWLYGLDAFLAFEDECLAAEYEGVMTRSAVGPYKCGRSSLREHFLVKYKRICDSEAIVLDVVEGKTNLNPIVSNAFGYAKRPGGGALKVPRGTMGHLECRDVHTGVYLSIGSGFTDAERADVWSDPIAYIGRILKYAYQDVGVKDKPRFPRFLGWRAPEDMSL